MAFKMVWALTMSCKRGHERLARHAGMGQRRGDGGGIVERLVDDQVRDDARIGVDHRAAAGAGREPDAVPALA